MHLFKSYRLAALNSVRFYSQSKSNSRIKDGPNLKDFILKGAQAETSPDEVLATQIFKNNIEKLTSYSDEIVERGEQSPRKVFFEVHGCQMNTNDTEVAYSILNETKKYVKTDTERDADVVLLMTCSIRDNAEQKIWNRLKDVVFRKKHQKSDLQIGILGCMAERLKDNIVHREKLVDVVCGPDSYRLLPDLLEQSRMNGQTAMNVQLSLEETYAEISPIRINSRSKTAFVSIQRGCDNMCSFCIVPFTRGRERSRPTSSILDEVRSLSDQGIKEITLLGQNVNSYLDKSEISVSMGSSESKKVELSQGFKTNYKLKSIGSGKTFVDLLDAVSLVNPEIRIRFTSPHPKDFPHQLIELIRDRPNICKTLHLPAQSGSTSCLERMRRGYTREAYLNLVDKIRSMIPSIAFTSDFIAGFCGETDEEHRDTITLMQQVKYTFCFMYAYSMREKTKAFHRLSDNVEPLVKHKRYLEMVDVFRKSADELNRTKLGQTHLVLIDQVSKRSINDYSGRNDNNTLVNFPNIELPYITSLDEYLTWKNNSSLVSTTPKQPQIGDYVACNLISSTSQSFRGLPLFSCKLETFDQIKTLGLL